MSLEDLETSVSFSDYEKPREDLYPNILRYLRYRHSLFHAQFSVRKSSVLGVLEQRVYCETIDNHKLNFPLTEREMGVVIRDKESHLSGIDGPKKKVDSSFIKLTL